MLTWEYKDLGINDKRYVTDELWIWRVLFATEIHFST